MRTFEEGMLSYFKNLHKKTEEEANQLLKDYGPYISQIIWEEKKYADQYFAEDIVRASEQGISPTDWKKNADQLENLIQNPGADTDLFKLKELFDNFDLGYEIKKTTPSNGVSISISAGDKKVTGYGGFTSTYQFDNNGKFIEVGIWE